MYSARISRKTPALFVILIDQNNEQSRSLSANTGGVHRQEFYKMMRQNATSKGKLQILDENMRCLVQNSGFRAMFSWILGLLLHF